MNRLTRKNETTEEIKKSIQCCYDRKCANCPNNCELGSGEIVCLYRLLPKIEDCLNEKDQQIAELKKEIKQLKFDCAMYKSANYLINDIGIDKAREIMFQSEKKLKQSQNNKAIEVLERAKIEFETYYADNIWNYPEWIDNQITELRGRNNATRIENL